MSNKDPFNIKNHVDYPKLIAGSKAQCQAQIQNIINKSLNQIQQLNQKIIALNQTIQKMRQAPLTEAQKKELCQVDATLQKPNSNSSMIQNHPEFSQYIKVRLAEQNLQNKLSQVSNKYKQEIEKLSQRIQTLENQNKLPKRDTSMEILAQERLKAEREHQENLNLREQLHQQKNCPKPKTVQDFDIRSHPQFTNYIKKIAVETKSQCPKPKTIGDFDVRTHPQFPDYIRTASAKALSTCSPQKNIKDYDIRSHPDYSALMNKYACATPGSNPVTYRPGQCNPPDYSQYIKKSEAATLLAQCPTPILPPPILTNAQTRNSIEGFTNNVNPPVDPELASKLLNPYIVRTFPIEKHPDYTKLMNQYACQTGPNSYRKGSCGPPPKCPILPINMHPDFKHYTLKSDANKPQPITSHPDYLKLMEQYACKTSNTCPPTFKRGLCQFPPISEHPDFPKYMLKSQTPLAIQDHPDFGNYIKRSEAQRMIPKCPPCAPCPRPPPVDLNQYISKSEAAAITRRAVEQEGNRVRASVLSTITPKCPSPIDLSQYVSKAEANAAVRRAADQAARTVVNKCPPPIDLSQYITKTEAQRNLESALSRVSSIVPKCPPIPNLSNYISKTEASLATEKEINRIRAQVQAQSQVQAPKCPPPVDLSQYVTKTEARRAMENEVARVTSMAPKCPTCPPPRVCPTVPNLNNYISKTAAQQQLQAELAKATSVAPSCPNCRLAPIQENQAFDQFMPKAQAQDLIAQEREKYGCREGNEYIKGICPQTPLNTGPGGQCYQPPPPLGYGASSDNNLLNNSSPVNYNGMYPLSPNSIGF